MCECEREGWRAGGRESERESSIDQTHTLPLRQPLTRKRQLRAD